jgi:RHS repeat-associated protein
LTNPHTPNDTDKFATYTRDSQTGLDYADQRFYNSTYGRFMTADPLRTGAVSVRNPISWNMYVYANDDPINFNDPTGKLISETGGGSCGPDWISDASLSGPCGPNSLGLYLPPTTPRDLWLDRAYATGDALIGSGFARAWDFTDPTKSSTLDITLSGDYSQFIQYLQDCGCTTINWNSITWGIRDLGLTGLRTTLPVTLALINIFTQMKPIGKPKDGLPTGTKGIDQQGWSHEEVEAVKKGIGARAADWVGVDGNGNVWTGSPSGGAVEHGPASSYWP